jgi:hypothetical protein
LQRAERETTDDEWAVVKYLEERRTFGFFDA